MALSARDRALGGLQPEGGRITRVRANTPRSEPRADRCGLFLSHAATAASEVLPGGGGRPGWSRCRPVAWCASHMHNGSSAASVIACSDNARADLRSPSTKRIDQRLQSHRTGTLPRPTAAASSATRSRLLFHFRRRISARRSQRARQRASQRQLLLLAVAAAGHVLDERERAAQAANRLFVTDTRTATSAARSKKCMARRLARLFEVGWRSTRSTLAQIRREELLERLRDAAVQQAAARRSDPRVGHFTDPVVAEIPPVRRLHADDLPPPQLIGGPARRRPLRDR